MVTSPSNELRRFMNVMTEGVSPTVSATAPGTPVILEAGRLDRAADHVKAFFGNERSKGAVSRHQLSQTMHTKWQRWLGQTGREGTFDDLERFFRNRVGFTDQDIKEIAGLAGIPYYEQNDQEQNESVVHLGLDMLAELAGGPLSNTEVDSIFDKAAGYALDTYQHGFGGGSGKKDPYDQGRSRENRPQQNAPQQYQQPAQQAPQQQQPQGRQEPSFDDLKRNADQAVQSGPATKIVDTNGKKLTIGGAVTFTQKDGKVINGEVVSAQGDRVIIHWEDNKTTALTQEEIVSEREGTLDVAGSGGQAPAASSNGNSEPETSGNPSLDMEGLSKSFARYDLDYAELKHLKDKLAAKGGFESMRSPDLKTLAKIGVAYLRNAKNL